MLSRLIGEDKGGQKEVRERTGRQGIEGGWREAKGQKREVGERTRNRRGKLRRGQGYNGHDMHIMVITKI